MKDIINIIYKEIRKYYHKYIYNSRSKNNASKIGIYIVIFFLFWFIGYKFRDKHIVFQNFKIKVLTNQQYLLYNEIGDLKILLNDYNKILDDGTFYKYLIFKYTGEMYNNINVDDLKLLYFECKKYNLNEKYLFRLLNKESRFNPNVVSPKGARGYMQVMPATFQMMKKLYKKDISKFSQNQQNIIIGCYYLHYLYKNTGNWKETISAYNSGKYDGYKYITETKNYVHYIIQ